jgi:uncharacterized protein YndB with AHSA1/START domain
MTNPISERTVTIVRVMDVPARYVFKAMAEPSLVIKWFGPGDYPLTLCEMDFRVGGKWRYQMTGPDGKTGPVFGGTYLEIAPDKRIVYDNRFESIPGDTKIMRVSLDEIDGKTTVTLQTEFASVAHKEAELARGYEIGTGMALTQLADLVKTLI